MLSNWVQLSLLFLELAFYLRTCRSFLFVCTRNNSNNTYYAFIKFVCIRPRKDTEHQHVLGTTYATCYLLRIKFYRRRVKGMRCVDIWFHGRDCVLSNKCVCKCSGGLDVDVYYRPSILRCRPGSWYNSDRSYRGAAKERASQNLCWRSRIVVRAIVNIG